MIMNQKLLITVERIEDLKPYIDAEKNALKLECLYDEVFRPVIRHEQDEKIAEAYELVWEKLKDYIYDS